MLMLVIGLLLFIGVHLLPTMPDLRNGVVARFGEGTYKVAFSIVAAAALAVIVIGYQKVQLTPGKNPLIWQPPTWGRHATMALMLPVFPLLIAAYLPGRITQAVRHPMVTAVKLWALAHLLVRGDAASMLLFGSLLAFAIYDRISLKQRESIGLVAIKSGPMTNDIAAVLGGLVLYGLFVKWGHAALIGIKLIP